MNDLIEIVNEDKSSSIKKIHMLTIMIAYQMWTEYKLYDEFFGKLSNDELESCKSLFTRIQKLDEDNSKVQFSYLKPYFSILNKIADYILSCPDDEFSKSDKKVWKEIKDNIS